MPGAARGGGEDEAVQADRRKATRRRLVSPRSRTGCAAEDCRRSCRQPPAPSCVPCAPCAACTCFFYAHAEIRPARRSALRNTLFTARLESIFAHGQEAGRRCSPAPSRTHAEAQANNAHFAHGHIHTHTHTPSTHAHTHARTHAHSHTHQYIAAFLPPWRTPHPYLAKSSPVPMFLCSQFTRRPAHFTRSGVQILPGRPEADPFCYDSLINCSSQLQR